MFTSEEYLFFVWRNRAFQRFPGMFRIYKKNRSKIQSVTAERVCAVTQVIGSETKSNPVERVTENQKEDFRALIGSYTNPAHVEMTVLDHEILSCPTKLNC